MNFLRGSSANFTTMLFKICCVWSVKYLSKVLIQPNKTRREIRAICTTVGKQSVPLQIGLSDAIHLYQAFMSTADTKDKKAEQVTDSKLWKKCCNRSKIKLIFYSTWAIPLRKLFSRVVSKKVTKKHFLCTFSVQQCRNILSNIYLTYCSLIYFTEIKVPHHSAVMLNATEKEIVLVVSCDVVSHSLFELLTCSWLKPFKSLLCI